MKTKTYKQMTRNERKVAIAKDVIEQINSYESYKMANQGYVNMAQKYKAGYIYDNVQETVCELKDKCTVCARGAMLLSKISRFNHVNMINLDYVIQSTTSIHLKDAFTNEQLNQIETAFEGRNYTSNFYGSLLVENALQYRADFPNPSERMIAIMQNVIDHGGEFRPHVKYIVKTIGV